MEKTLGLDACLCRHKLKWHEASYLHRQACCSLDKDAWIDYSHQLCLLIASQHHEWECSSYFWRYDRSSGCRCLFLWFAQNFGRLVYPYLDPHCRDLMKSGGRVVTALSLHLFLSSYLKVVLLLWSFPCNRIDTTFSSVVELCLSWVLASHTSWLSPSSCFQECDRNSGCKFWV